MNDTQKDQALFTFSTALSRLKRWNYLPESMLLLASLIWGGGFPATKLALNSGLTASMVMAIRFSGAALLFGILFRRELRKMPLREWLIGTGVGLLLYFGFITQTVGLVLSTPSRNAFLTATYVVMVPLFSALLYRQRPQKRIVFGAFLCFAGVSILTVSVQGLSETHLTGDLLTLLCAVCFAFQLIALESAITKVSVPRLIFLQMFTAAVCSLLVLPLDWVPLASINWAQGGPSMLYLLLFSSCVAYFLQTYAQRHTSAARTAILLSLEALFGSLLAIIFGFDRFSFRLIFGGLIIFSAILLVEWPTKREPLP